MPKASVDITSASREEIEGLLAEFGLEGYTSDYISVPSAHHYTERGLSQLLTARTGWTAPH